MASPLVFRCARCGAMNRVALLVPGRQPVCGRCDKPTRVGTKRLDDGHGVRICRRCGEQLDKA